jgi:hypothetical protein
VRDPVTLLAIEHMCTRAEAASADAHVWHQVGKDVLPRDFNGNGTGLVMDAEDGE